MPEWCFVKIGCHCGATIVDQTDDLPNKGHLVPDQLWFAKYDAIDDEIIDPVAAGRLDAEAAKMRVRSILGRGTRLMWQCSECGRLYIDNLAGNLQCYIPSGEETERRILRGLDVRQTP